MIDANRFWSRVKKGDSNECWPWIGWKNTKGYGMVHLSKSPSRRTMAHRVAHELTAGPIPVGHEVCHHCDNPPCCNPAHLFAGTKSDNMRDMMRKGRNGGATRRNHHAA